MQNANFKVKFSCSLPISGECQLSVFLNFSPNEIKYKAEHAEKSEILKRISYL
jgi:hypothetical protein